MSSFDKVVKLACKPKAAPPKAKYLEPIIAATWSDDGAVHDVCKALSPRFREPNAIVVFKALIVLHTMIRNGATDNVLSYLSSSEVLRLRNVSAGNWEVRSGYAAPENLQNYAIYLDSRIRAYHDLKHDAVRVQAESNRDMRNSASIEEDNYRSRNNGKTAPATSPSSGPNRSKTIMGRKLRVMTVEKGLLRETKAVHRMVDALVECRFYLDDLEDELTTTALRMLVKDLLILFQAGNEGVINVLEHYFEMSHVDAEQALAIYRHFCKQTERVVEFLGVAKKLQNLLNVPIPNLKHAPVSLAGALQEYLDDPNFEQNRIEYKTNKEAAERSNKPGSKPRGKIEKAPTPAVPTIPPTTAQRTTDTSTSNALSSPAAGEGAKNKDAVDFFSAISEEQPANSQTTSPNSAFSQQQSASNPFAHMQIANGQPYMQQQLSVQPTGYLQPQQTAFQIPPSNPFGIQISQQQSGHRPFAAFLPQATGFSQPQQFQPQPPQAQLRQPQSTGSLQPQATGVNPFRQSMMFPQSTGMALFSGSGQGQTNDLQNRLNPQGQGGPSGFNQMTPFTSTGIAFSATSAVASPFAQPPSFGSAAPLNHLPTRPSSTPLTSFGSTSTAASPPPAQAVKTHQTGTRNPFGPIVTLPPPVPKQPTLMELGMGIGGNNPINGMQSGQQQQQQQHSQPPHQQQQTGAGGFGFNSDALGAGATDISSVASSFAFKADGNTNINPQPGSSRFPLSGALNAQNTAATTTGSTFSDSVFSSLPTQPTGATNTSSAPSVATSSQIRPQLTGFANLKPFKPSSSFGASLLGSLPPIPGSSPTTPAMTGNGASSGSSGLSSGSGGLSFAGSFSGSSQPTSLNSQTSNAAGGAGSSGSTLGQGVRPQMTGGAANPFRASMMGSPTGGAPNFGASPTLGSPGFTSQTSFGSNLFGGGGAGFGSGLNPNQNQQQQQNGFSSLI